MVEFIAGVRDEFVKAVFACLTLGFGWFAGQRIITYWDIKKKRQELDIAAATDFHKLYGEFKEVSRLWRAYLYTGPSAQKVAFPDTLRLELLRRASAAEGSIEAITVKLATERLLNEEEIRGTDALIDVTRGGEFRAWRWMPFERIVEGAADFRKPVYRRLAEQFQKYLS